MPYCNKCGAALQPGEKFCGSCGALQDNPAPEYEAPVRSYREKSELIALLLSFLIPGLGQIYVGKFMRGAVFFIILAILYGSGLFLVFTWVIGFIGSLYCIYDAYKLAKEYNRALNQTGQVPW